MRKALKEGKRQGRKRTESRLKSDSKLIVRNSRQFIKFILVGILNTLFGYGCFALFLLYMKLHYSLALLLATVVGVLFNFKTTGALVFSSHNNRLIFRFIASYIIIYTINASGIAALLQIGIPPHLGGAILIVPMAIIAFLLNKKFVFN